MSAGFSPAGYVPAGFSPGVVPEPLPAGTPPHALYLDPSVMDFPRGDDGRYLSVHPVDQKVELRLLVQQGSIRSAPTLGSTLRDIAIGTREAMTRAARVIVDAALSDLVSAGEVEVVSVVAFASAPNRARVEVQYRNLLLPDARDNRTVVVG